MAFSTDSRIGYEACFADGERQPRLRTRDVPPRRQRARYRQCAFLEESGSDNLHRPDINIQGHRFY